MRRRNVLTFLALAATGQVEAAVATGSCATQANTCSAGLPFLLLRNYGLDQNGMLRAFAAAAQSGATASNVMAIVVDAAVAIVASMTVPAHVSLKFVGGGRLQIANGVTLAYLGLVDDCLSHIFDVVGTGVVCFAGSRQRTFRPEWWGAVGNGGSDGSDDYPAVFACLSQAGTYNESARASAGQGRVLLNGNYALHSTLIIPNDVELVGIGSSMETGFTLIGPTQLLWPNFRSSLCNAMIQVDRCSASPAILFDSSSGSSYRNMLDRVWVRGVNTVPDNQIGIEFARCQATVARSLRVDVTGGASRSTGIRITSGCLGLELTSPDVEACSTCILTDGTGSATIDNPYIERHTIYGIHVAGTGYVNIRGGNIRNPTSQQDAIALDDCRNCTVDGVDTGVTGYGVVAWHGSAPFGNVNIRGVSSDRILDTNHYLQIK